LGYSRVLTQRSAPDGRASAAAISAVTGVAARHLVPLSADAAGSPASAPRSHGMLLAREATAALVATVALGRQALQDGSRVCQFQEGGR
jgi:ribosomal protein L18